jgi:hypothetical protein
MATNGKDRAQDPVKFLNCLVGKGLRDVDKPARGHQ